MTAPDSYRSPADRLAALNAEIDDACHISGRDRAEVTLIAVSKTFPAEIIEPFLAAGQRVFGENRVQEAAGKWPGLKEVVPDTALHLVGPLQSNKLRDAVALFDVIHSLDREKLARRLAEEREASGRCPDLFIQVNTGEEPQKAGILPPEADTFIRLCRDDLGLPIIGLMCLPPMNEAPSPHFALLRKIAHRNGLLSLSMGMSADWPTAIAFGATHIRLGTALFGQRAPH